MKLDTYLSQNNITIAQFAETVGVHQSTIWRIVEGHRNPGPQLIWSISKATGGMVNLCDFVDVTKNGGGRVRRSQGGIQ